MKSRYYTNSLNFFILSFIFSLFALRSFSQEVEKNVSDNIADNLAMINMISTNISIGNIPKPGNITGSTTVCQKATGIVYSIRTFRVQSAICGLPHPMQQ